jgi:hypothetical protein
LFTTLTQFQAPTQVAHLFRAEDAIRRRCTLVASRLELAASALVLLEVACHADAALDDLDNLADARGIILETASSRVRAWVSVLFAWLGDLWPASATHGYWDLLEEMRRNLALAKSLRASCVASGDRRMADWCALWTEQRAELANRLSASLESDSQPGS